jgi:threonine dehydratase
MIPLDDFVQARERITPYVSPSPLRRSQWLSTLLDAEVYLKLECLQPGNSFKIRGATNALLSQDQLPERVITASGGNHGIGVTIAATRMDIPVSVILPTSTSAYRIKLLEELGADVTLHGDAWDQANEYAQSLAQDKGVLYIHPFADLEVMQGQGTIALELVEELGDFDLLVASVGGGGLLAGISQALKGMEKPTRIYSVETRGADSLAQSLQQQQLVELPAITSIAKTLGARKTTPFIFNIMQQLIARYFVVDDADAVKALWDFLDYEKLLVEPATSCIIAAVLQNQELFRKKRVVLIICGSNVSLQEVEDWKLQFGT